VTAVALAHPSATLSSVGIKAFDRIATHWGLTVAQAAGLADMSESTWKRARKLDRPVELSQDQILRFSALVGIYKALNLYFDAALADAWPTRPNTGPLFEGARPVDVLLAGGLPQFLEVRRYLDALRGGM